MYERHGGKELAVTVWLVTRKTASKLRRIFACLIALQALQDIMDETEPLPKEFVDYLTSIKAWEHNWRIREYLRES